MFDDVELAHESLMLQIGVRGRRRRRRRAIVGAAALAVLLLVGKRAFIIVRLQWRAACMCQRTTHAHPPTHAHAPIKVCVGEPTRRAAPRRLRLERLRRREQRAEWLLLRRRECVLLCCHLREQVNPATNTHARARCPTSDAVSLRSSLAAACCSAANRATRFFGVVALSCACPLASALARRASLAICAAIAASRAGASLSSWCSPASSLAAVVFTLRATLASSSASSSSFLPRLVLRRAILLDSGSAVVPGDDVSCARTGTWSTLSLAAVVVVSPVVVMRAVVASEISDGTSALVVVVVVVVVVIDVCTLVLLIAAPCSPSLAAKVSAVSLFRFPRAFALDLNFRDSFFLCLRSTTSGVSGRATVLERVIAGFTCVNRNVS
jgi:hypothetical protein